ncbi:MAG: RNA polymerase sigma factor SigZ [Bacteroidetes bacterium]|nr:RNA polymerase sigma factor SigZ [Bacteroidota bacterium]MBI3483235.1 RNA polymerase sigma factor SigZ [Bacteroidota bacterium]
MEAIAAPISFFQNELKGFVYKRVKNMALAEDIVHDVFIKVQSKSGQLKETEKITGWIYQITKNTIIDHFRKQSKSINISELDWENETPNFNECVSSCLKDMLPKLPEKYRVALELTELENLSQLQLAERLGISYSGAKSRVQRARQMLKEKMDEILIIKTDVYGNVIVCVDRPGCC